MQSFADVYDDAEFWERRACYGIPTKIFFPPRGGRLDEARKVCASCPVRVKCVQYYGSSGPEMGFIAGMSPDERKALRRKAS